MKITPHGNILLDFVKANIDVIANHLKALLLVLEIVSAIFIVSVVIWCNPDYLIYIVDTCVIFVIYFVCLAIVKRKL